MKHGIDENDNLLGRIGDFDKLVIRETRTGIQPPMVPNDNFEINPMWMDVVQNSRFSGLTSENPFTHLDLFERFCTMINNVVPQDDIKMILFPFSLEDKASEWERNIASDLVLTWEQVKHEFLNKFFSKQKAVKLRNEILGFKQSDNEAFHEAWDRFKEYTTACPHHRFADDFVLDIFYRGCLVKYREFLDIASNGSFTKSNVNQRKVLIENFAQNDQYHDGVFDQNLRPSTFDDKLYKELSVKLDQVLQMQKGMKYFGECDGYGQRTSDQWYEETSNDGRETVLEEMNYVDNQGGYQYKPYNNLSYWDKNVENPKDQTYPQVQKPQEQDFQQRYQPHPYNNNAPYQLCPYNNQGGYQKPAYQANQGWYQRPSYQPNQGEY